MAEIIGPAYDKKDFAGFFRRTCALAIDLTIIVGLWLVLIVTCFLIGPRPYLPDETGPWQNFLLVVIAIVYMLGLRMSMRGTLGYRLMRIRYAYMLGEKPTVLIVMFRSVVSVVFLLFFCLDHIWILFDERKQAWHDKVSGFYVIKSGAQPTGTARMARRLITFMNFTFVVWEPLDEVILLPPSSRQGQ